MLTVSRRDALLAGAAFGLAGPLRFASSARAEEFRDAGFYRYSIGEVEIISLYDGVWEKPHDEGFIDGATVDETKAALRAGGLTDAHVPIEFSTTIVKTGGKTILIDAGTGGQLAPTAGKMSAGMAAAGVAPEDVDTVVISHMHPDHIFGLMAPETNDQIFPNAEIQVGEAELAFWTDPSIIQRLPERRRGLAQRIQATFPMWGNVSRYGDDAELATGLRSVSTPGHTPGHMAFHISSGNQELMIVGDLVLLPTVFARHPDWRPVFDSDKDQAEATRRAIMARVVDDGMMIAGYHFGFPNSGTLSRDGDGFLFAPVGV